VARAQTWQRKTRWGAHHLLLYEPRAVVYLLLAYSKGQRDDLSAREKRILKQLVWEEFK